MSGHKALNSRIITPTFLFLVLVLLIGGYYGVQRFMEGMGAVSNLNGGFSWGLWVVYDVVVGTAFACGGYALAFTVYLFNKGKYHPLVRPAVLASLLATPWVVSAPSSTWDASGSSTRSSCRGTGTSTR